MKSGLEKKSESVCIGLLGDGADRLLKHMKASFPKGRGILDNPFNGWLLHWSRAYLLAAKAHYGERSIKGLEWVESAITRLLFGGIGYVIGGLCRMEPQDTGAKGQIRKLIGYLDHNRGKDSP
jgi:hypothetical protein